MKRLVITGPRRAAFQEAPIPDCPKDGLLVRAIVTAVSTGTELRVYRWIPVDEEGKYLHAGALFPDGPIENGYSMVGEVAELGADTSGFSRGDRVFLGGTHKEYATTPAGLATSLPDTVTDEQAVFLNILGVGQSALRTGTPTPGENVAVIGLGVIGLSTLAYCKAFGMRTAAVDVSHNRLAIARQMGADLAADPRDDDFEKRVLDLFDGVGADLVVEAASTWEAIKTGMAIARKDAKVIVVARHTDVPNFNSVGHPYLDQRLTLRTSYGYEPDGHRWDRRRSMALTLEMLAKGNLPIDPMITHRFTWRDLPSVYGRFDRGDPDLVGAVIRWS